MKSTIAQLKNQFETALVNAFGPDLAGTDPILVPASNPKFGDFQANVAMSLAKHLKDKPRAIAEKLVENLDVSALCEEPAIAGPGFINLKLKPSYINEQLKAIQGDDSSGSLQSNRLGIQPVSEPQKIIVDFSSPNIAKEMHVGHLRSTIIGDSIARVLEFQGHHVLRLNHVGDWGTQFGMLITHLKEVCPEALADAESVDIGDLVAFYKQAKQRFDEDEDFKETSRQAVVGLQSGDADSLKAWQVLCQQSRKAFQEIYDRLDIRLEERGESFYNPYLPDVIAGLKAAQLLETDDGAEVVFLEGFTNKEGDRQPLIIQKSNGGFNYATTDLAAIRYRTLQDQAQRIIYITDAGQANHFAQVFQVANRADWVPAGVSLEHVPFGVVQGEDGKKFKTRSGETIRLKDLLDEAVVRARQDVMARIAADDRQESTEFVEDVAQKVGLGAVKYADLSQNRTSNYIFSFDKMLALQGNTAPYMLYAYARVKSISRKGEVDFAAIDSASITVETETELALAKHILQLDEILDAVEADLLPNRLCQYLFELSQKFNQFYEQCSVLQAEEPQRTSRLVLCDLTARSLQLGLSLLGIRVLERM